MKNISPFSSLFITTTTKKLHISFFSFLTIEEKKLTKTKAERKKKKKEKNI